MPLTSFLIVVGGLVGVLGMGVPYLFGVPGGPTDEGSRGLLWVSVVAFPLFLAPAASVWKLQRLTRGMAIFATVCGGLIGLFLLWTGTPHIASLRIGWVVEMLSALTLATGGAMAIRSPPDASF